MDKSSEGMRITLEIGNLSKGKTLLSFLKTIEYIKSIHVEDEKLLSDDEWILSGRKATDIEFEMLAEEMDNDTSRESMDTVFNRLYTKYPK
ncbi:MAG: hypothetical protein HOB88_01355 [Bacteroidetes bacterium]|nr:hypothetical protein [Bacteroidota bacterium]